MANGRTAHPQLGLLSELGGTWHGWGFNLVGRPGFDDAANVFLELNMTKEILTFEPIASSIPNRGTFQSDIELSGLTYLQKISDAVTGSMLHIESGVWVTQPATTEPARAPPPGGQLVARMGSIPNGNALLAEGTAFPFSGPPTLSPSSPLSGGNPAFSHFPSFNSTPMTPPFPTPIFSAGTSEFQSKPNHGFSQYTLTNAPSPNNPRTPLGNIPPVLHPRITQDLVNDAIVLLQQKIQEQVAEGYQFLGVVLNISSSTQIQFFTHPAIFGLPAPAVVTVYEPTFGGVSRISLFSERTPKRRSYMRLFGSSRSCTPISRHSCSFSMRRW